MSGDAIDLLFDWRDERDREAEQKPWGGERPKNLGGAELKPWPPCEVTEDVLAEAPSVKVCNTCHKVYPDTNDFFPHTVNAKRGLYVNPRCRGCNRERVRVRWAKKKYRYGLTTRFARQRHQAGQRGILWNLDHEDVRDLYDTPCHYCGGEVEQRLGLDRVDNDKGYIPDNVVQCCWTCNQMKSSRSVGEWTAHMRRVLEHLESSDAQ